MIGAVLYIYTNLVQYFVLKEKDFKMKIVTRERKNPLNDSKTMYVFEFVDEDDVKAFNFMIKNAIRKLNDDDAKRLEDLRTKLKERTSDRYARPGVQKSTFLFSQ